MGEKSIRQAECTDLRQADGYSAATTWHRSQVYMYIIEQPLESPNDSSSVSPFSTLNMATQQGPARRNGVIGFQMTGTPTPATPLIAPPRNGPIGFQLMPGPSCTTNPPSLVNQGPPHRITPLVGPDTAHSSSRSVRPSQTQREVSALSERLADAEAVISRQESELDHAKSQASALRSEMIHKRVTTKFIDQHQMEVMITQANKNRSQNIEAQLRILEDQLDQTAVNLELAEGKKNALQDCKQQLTKDQADLQDLRHIVADAEYNARRHERLKGAEDRVKGLLRNMERMMATALEETRVNQARSSATSVGMSLNSCRSSRQGSPMEITPSSREGSPMEITTEPTEHEHAAHMLQADESQVNDRNAAVREAPATTLTITPQQVEINNMMGNQSQLFHSELANLNAEAFDGYMEWELTQTITILNEDDQAAPSQASSGPSLPFFPAITVNSNEDVLMVAGQVTSAVIPPDSGSSIDLQALSPRQREILDEGMEIAHSIPKLPSDRARVFKRQDRLTGSLRRYVRRRVIEIGNPPVVNLPVRKRTAGIVEFSHNEGPNRKKRITKELVEANGSLLLSLSEVYVMNTAPKVPEVSVPAVSQPAQPVHVSTEEVPTQAVMSEPAVSQPTQTVLEYTETVSTEQVPTEAAMSAPAVPQPTQATQEATEQVPIDAALSEPAVSQPTGAVSEEDESLETVQVPTEAVMSEPAVSQPTQTVLEYTETASTEQVPTEAAMSAPAVPQLTQATQEATKPVPIDAALSEPAVSQPTGAVSEEDESLETVQVSTDAVMSVPAVSQPTQAVLESTVPESSVLQCTSLASTVSIPSDEVVGAPAPSEPAPTKSAQTEPSSAEEIQSVPAVTKPTLNESDLAWQTEEDELVVPSLRTGTRSHLDVLLAMRAARTQARPNIMSSPKGLQVTATSRIISTSSLVASPEDASVKNAVATGTDSRAGVSKGTKRVEDANPTCGAQQTAGEQREEKGGEEAATSGLQMPGAWPSDPPAVTVSDESDTHEGSALLRGLWTGARWVSFAVFVMVMVMLLSFPVWAGHLGHLVYALEGPEQFLEELRWEHGYDVPFLERIIYVFLRCFAGDRTLFG
ncbi:hypothetical protein PENPOL_c005G00286 [Penicillium polonicum]|uniref:Uncharacterized protein n=1 Tax=Penicillium polonicum TaxID=60169 RepID=A0A1V6NM53_PENPO|nr:hypothetical protein PENPOL_c005G00286 [Penicillium polonicum]